MGNTIATQELPLGVVQKILQFAAPTQYVPVVKLHQKCVLGPQWRLTINGPVPSEVLPTKAQQSVFESLEELVGMGRVNTWTDAGDGQPSCRAAEDEPLDKVNDESSSFLQCTNHPLYFDFLARNMAGSETTTMGTSHDWRTK